MLIRFITSNFLSFNDEIEFSMIAGKSRQHPHHIIKGNGRNDLNLLKAGVVYGANAAGKSNLVKAMAFARQLIVNGTKPKKSIPVQQFKFDTQVFQKPSKFEFEFKQNNQAYAYGFELDTQKIHNEWLYLVGKTNEKVIFERKTNEKDVTTIEFGQVDFDRQKDKQFTQFAAMGTRPNQLFLTESVERNIKHFESVFNWFSTTLKFVYPTSRPMGLEIQLHEDAELKNYMLKLLDFFDVGISDLSMIPIDLPDILDIPEEIREDILNDLEPGQKGVLNLQTDKRYILSKAESGDISVFKLVTKHKVLGKDDLTSLEIEEESDGTRRLIDLIPALITLFDEERVFVIDELDRSLHPNLSYKLLQLFLEQSVNLSGQMVVTTHESNLLDLKLLRRDEVWFIEKDKNGASSVYSLEEFAPRYDKDVQKGYLFGRFGAIPFIGNTANLSWR